ncbi:MAG: hypothetical protein ILP13_08245 [Lachnospiraceae bacterium]|nr:hypothetical protein [Lachnospiraceae bacterium]
MDKYEYKIRAEEIRSLIQENKYKEAVEIADSIDWKNIKNSMMLCTVSDLYKACKRYEDSRDVLLLAYERNPGGRMILYSLCELSIKLGDVVNAIEYYKEFQQVAPKDSGRYVLKYKLFTMQEVGLEERIEVLEELQRIEPKEKWMYELAYLYHMVGQGEKCVEECNQLVIFFGDGRYVEKALELKMMHEPLSEEQEALYKRLTEPDVALVKDVDVSNYNTMDLQKELADNLKEVLFDDGKEKEPEYAVATIYETVEDETPEAPVTETTAADNTVSGTEDELPKETPAESAANDEAETLRVSEPEPEAVNTEEPSENNTAAPVGGDMAEITAPKSEPEAEEPATRIFTASELKEIRENTAPVNERVSDVILPKNDPLNIHSVRVDANTNPAIKFPNFDDMMALEGDGQISLVVPEQEMLEKQITGQISIDDVLAEWEKVKSDNERKWQADVRRRVMEQTNNMFRDFDENSKNGLLEELEETVSEADTVELTPEEVTALRHEYNSEALNIDIEEPEEFEDTEESEDIKEPETTAEETEAAPPVTPGMSTEEIRSEAVRLLVETVKDVHEITLDESENEEPEEELKVETPTEEPEAENTTEHSGEHEIELAHEITSHAPEPDADDNTAVLPNAEELDYLMKFAAASEERDLADLANQENTESDREEPSEPEETIEETTEEPETEPAEEPVEPAESEELPKAEDTEPEVSETEPEVTEESKEETSSDVEPEENINNVIPEPYVNTFTGLTEEQSERFESFVQKESGREQVIDSLAKLSMDADHGNAIIGSDDNDGSVEFAKALILELSSRGLISGKAAKIKASTLNAKDAYGMLTSLYEGAIIIQDADELRPETLDAINRATAFGDKKLFIAMTVNKRHKHRFIMEHANMLSSFDVSVDIDAETNSELARFAKSYAYSKEYAIDEMGMLALHTRIEERQTNSHSVTVGEVKEIVDEAIVHASKKNVGHFFNVLMGKRYDANDMIVLKEKDFTGK